MHSWSLLKGTQKGLVEILTTYDRKENEFLLGGHKLRIDTSEVDLIFGISSGQKEVNMCSCSIAESSLGRRRFSRGQHYRVITTLLIQSSLGQKDNIITLNS